MSDDTIIKQCIGGRSVRAVAEFSFGGVQRSIDAMVILPSGSDHERSDAAFDGPSSKSLR